MGACVCVSACVVHVYVCLFALVSVRVSGFVCVGAYVCVCLSGRV